MSGDFGVASALPLVYLRIAAFAIALLLLHCIFLFAAVLPLLLLRLLSHCSSLPFLLLLQCVIAGGTAKQLRTHCASRQDKREKYTFNVGSRVLARWASIAALPVHQRRLHHHLRLYGEFVAWR